MTYILIANIVLFGINVGLLFTTWKTLQQAKLRYELMRNLLNEWDQSFRMVVQEPRQPSENDN